MTAIVQFVQYGSFSIQNFWTSGQSFGSRFYSFAPFLFRGAAAELGGENSDAFIAFSNNALVLSTIANRSALNDTVIVTSVWLTQSLTVSPSPPPREELYIINSVAFSDERVEVRLRSPVDAANTRFPNRRLTSGLVGNLPRDGQVRVA